MGSTFTKRYKCVDLVYYEFYDHIATAIDREKQLKNWKRAWKDQIILELNPELKDLSDSIEDMI